MKFNIEIIGTVGRDADTKQVNGQTLTTFSVATKPKYNNDSTVWVKVTTWGKQAETHAQYVKKGMLVYVAGTPDFDNETGKPRIYTGRDGVVKSSGFEVTASEVKYLSKVTHTDNTPTVQTEIDVDELMKSLDINTTEQIPF